MIGKTFKTYSGNVYKITKPIAAGNRPNANVYLCEDQSGAKFILKHFYNNTPRAFVGYSKYNHYGILASKTASNILLYTHRLYQIKPVLCAICI